MNMSKGPRSQHERAPSSQSWNNLSNKMNSTVLDYNIKYNINMHKSILTQVKYSIK